MIADERNESVSMWFRWGIMLAVVLPIISFLIAFYIASATGIIQ